MAENVYIPHTKIDWTANNVFAQFKLWRKEVERIIGGPLAEKTDEVKINHIYIWAGAHAETLIEARQNEDPTVKIKKPKQLLDELALCLTHSTFFREIREQFYVVKQKPNENTTTYFSRIMELYRQADFPDGTDFLIVDKLIHGCLNQDCKCKLMIKNKDATLKECLDLMRRYEAVDVTMKRLEHTHTEESLHAVYSRDPTLKSQRSGARRKPPSAKTHKPPGHKSFDSEDCCGWCGGEKHSRGRCPAKSSRCNYCKIYGHFESVCNKKTPGSTKQQNTVQAATESDDSDYGEHDLGSVTVNSLDKHKSREVFAPVMFQHRSHGHTNFSGKVDTGAMVSCMPLTMIKQIGLSKEDLKTSKSTVKGISGAILPNVGTVSMHVSCNNITSVAKFYVIDSDCAFILGIEFCKKFKLVTIAPICTQYSITIHDTEVNAVHIANESEVNYHELAHKWKSHLPLGKVTGDPLCDLKHIFPETFDGGVGMFDGKVELKLSPNAKPTQLPPRAVPQSLMSKLKADLDEMEKDGIIRACPETTEWVHNLVVAMKKNGTLRLCLDTKTLNEHLIRNVHYTASWEDVQHSFKGGQYFSTLDAKSGYWTKQLSNKSQLLTAFNTPFKKYCFLRLPFGLSVSSEIFSEEMDRVLSGIPGTFPCADDVKVQGTTEERHDIHLLETVERAFKAGLKFNPDKCHIKKQEIEYFGRIITPLGVKPCPKKVKAISNIEAPTNKQELQSLLGTVNFMSTFVSNLTSKTHLMRSLLKRDKHFIWTNDMQKELDLVKMSIADAVQLNHYDPNKPAVIETDASLKGLGAVLLQEGRPVKFLSKALTPTEAAYSNIERELLAVLFACEKLHNYIFGREIKVHTDHKPLENIFKKAISLAPSRLQRMLLRLAKYNPKVEYVGSSKVLVADTLSRLISQTSAKDIPGLDLNIAQVLVIATNRLSALQEETKADKTLADLQHYIMYGWPEAMQDLPVHLHPYWCFRDELVILDGLVMKGNRVIVPQVMRADTLQRMHDAHQGLTSTLQRARKTVYWPNMQDDITNLIQACDECQIHGRKKPRPPERQVSAVRPMEIIGMDILEHRGRSALVTVDYYSGFITYDPIENQTSEAVIKALNNIFRKFGFAERIISDNGPCFKSMAFSLFCKELDIHHSSSSPHYHQSNGKAERAIGTIKAMLKKSSNDIQITKAFTAYLDTPVSDALPSPAELFHSRRIHTRLSMAIGPRPLTDQQKQQLLAKRSGHLTTPQNDVHYTPNQPIWFTEDNTEEWRAGFIESQHEAPDSYWIITEEGKRRLRRNKHDIKSRILKPVPQPYDDTLSQNFPPLYSYSPGGNNAGKESTLSQHPHLDEPAAEAMQSHSSENTSPLSSPGGKDIVFSPMKLRSGKTVTS